MYREIRSYANSIWDDNNNNNKMARPNDKLVVEARMLYERNMRQDSEVEMYRCRLVA